jgi:integrase
MAIFKRGKKYWFHFTLNGEHVQQSTNQGNRDVARNKEAECRARLVKDHEDREQKARKLSCKPEDLRNCSDCGNLFNAANPITSLDGQHVFCSEVCEDKWQSRQSPTPMFAIFAERFREEMTSRHEKKPKTVSYYKNGIKRLLESPSFRDARLDRIDEKRIAEYVMKRKAAKKRNGKTIQVSTVNRELEVLRRMLRLANEWKIIPGVPKISRLPGERQRDRILNHGEEGSYLAIAKQPLRDVATIILDAGMRPEEVFRLRWENVHLKPAGKALYGYIFNPFGKTKAARRNVPMTQRVRALLEMRHTEQKSPAEGWVFPAPTKSERLESLKSQHKRALKDSKVTPFVLYSLRHTMLTRLGEAGADAFSIQKIAGHSSILISSRYVHPTEERTEGAFTRLESYNAQKLEELEKERKQEQMVQ